MLGGLCVGKVRVQVACVFFADYSINDSKSSKPIIFNQPATKTLATGQLCVKKCEGKSLNLGRAGKPCQSCSWTGFVYFHKNKTVN
jgi:hypothetical protein